MPLVRCRRFGKSTQVETQNGLNMEIKICDNKGNLAKKPLINPKSLWIKWLF
jgi:hypothetical protein